jgi:enoyl-[acyl-carrier protein] reductase/trans-2-enoyl-CoA reductase (NAD+)
MGGEDWQLWIKRLEDADLLAEGAQTIAYSYIGPEVTHSIYRHGTIGKAKEHLEATARRLNNRLRLFGGRAIVAVNKAVVTRASSVIPAVPLYISILYKVMKERGFHEGCIEQSYRLFNDFISKKQPVLDGENRIRLDDLELRNDVQEEVLRIWEKVNSENLASLTDIRHTQDDFYKFFGFRLPTVNYRVNINIKTWMN